MTDNKTETTTVETNIEDQIRSYYESITDADMLYARNASLEKAVTYWQGLAVRRFEYALKIESESNELRGEIAAIKAENETLKATLTSLGLLLNIKII